MNTDKSTQARTAAGPLILILILVLALAACGSPDGGAAGGGGARGPDTPVTDSPAGGSGGGGDPKVVSPQAGMTGAEPIEWDKVTLAPDGRKLWVRWWSGVEPCYVLDRVQVHIDHRVVMITLWEGHDPAEKKVACPEMAVLKETKVTLSQPLDGRRVLDGAKVEAMADPAKCRPQVSSLDNCPLMLHPNPRVQRPR